MKNVGSCLQLKMDGVRDGLPCELITVKKNRINEYKEREKKKKEIDPDWEFAMKLQYEEG